MPTPQGRVASLVIVEFLDFANVLQPQVTRNTPTVGQTWLHWLTAGREKERERNITVWLPLMPPTGDLAHDPGLCLDWESNWRPFGLQSGTQSTEPHQPGLKPTLLIGRVCGPPYTPALNLQKSYDRDMLLSSFAGQENRFREVK